ncbi:MAG: ubiquinol-cytochrome C reductase [Peptococcaceae bacterium BRH_c8a]|nr:MAG: ubiquinol-cytochrome C reductase [Peptococcaceae bacterium BRH_c8a]
MDYQGGILATVDTCYWLVKTEPQEYSYEDLEKRVRDVWDGVKNPVALKNLQDMRPGDPVFIYHTGNEKAIIGVARVVSLPYPDPSNGALPVVELASVYRLSRPVTLSEIKQDPTFEEWELVHQPRLSVMPLTQNYWDKIHAMSGNGHKE